MYTPHKAILDNEKSQPTSNFTAVLSIDVWAFIFSLNSMVPFYVKSEHISNFRSEVNIYYDDTIVYINISKIQGLLVDRSFDLTKNSSIGENNF